MKIAKEYEKHIFCLEGNWEDDLRNKKSIKPTLTYLTDCFNIENIHRHCATKDEFEYYIDQYDKYNEYSILYFAFHGNPNGISLGKDEITLDYIEEKCYGKLTNKIVHFGSCSSLNIKKSRIIEFINNTKALCVSGYKTDIDFNKSTVLDILYFEKCQHYKDIRCIERDMKQQYKALLNSLKFIMLYD
ncbi:DUF6642 family protein [Flavobacterium sp. RNTU_13]|uniref:DUF6642 family protein n=1 Tax=Flavobacterium sp. RNTU_13 TaxID=3375145 RepID=UPI003985C9B0